MILDDVNEINSLQLQIQELEIENRRLQDRPMPTYDAYNMRYSRDDLLMMLAEMDKAKEREQELEKQEEKRIPFEPAYHTVIKLGHDAEIEVNDEDITIVISAPNGMKHCLEIDIGSIFHIIESLDYEKAKEVSERSDAFSELVANRNSEWRYEIFDCNNIQSLLNPQTAGGK